MCRLYRTFLLDILYPLWKLRKECYVIITRRNFLHLSLNSWAKDFIILVCQMYMVALHKECEKYNQDHHIAHTNKESPCTQRLCHLSCRDAQRRNSSSVHGICCYRLAASPRLAASTPSISLLHLLATSPPRISLSYHGTSY